MRNHALVDGNTRLGWLSVSIFYGLHDVDLDAPDDEADDLIISVIDGSSTVTDSAESWSLWH